MAGFDSTNVASTVGQGVPQPDPLATVGKFAALQNALNQNRLFQAQSAGGQAYANSLNPDGTVNRNALTAAFQRNPQLGIVAPEMLQAGQALATGQQGLAATQKTAAQNILGSVLPDTSIADPAARAQDQYKRASVALARAEAAGVIPKGMGAQTVGEGFPGLAIGDAAQQAALQTGNAAEVGQQVGTPIAVSTGQGTVLLNEKLAQGVVNTVGFVQGAQSPSEMGALVPYTDASGVTHMVPKSVIQTTTGQPIPNVAGITGPHGEILTGIGPAASANLATTGAGQGQAALALQSQAAGVPSRKANLDILSNEADQFQPGPQSNFWLHLQGLAKEYGVPLPGGPPADSVAAQQEFNKVATMVSGAQRAAIGLSGTDQQTALAGQATPNATLSKQGIARVIGTLQGNEDYTNAQYQLWEKSRLDPSYAKMPFDQFQASFNRNVNPLVFQSIYASPADRAKMIQEVGPAKFKAQYKALFNQGLIPNGQ